MAELAGRLREAMDEKDNLFLRAGRFGFDVVNAGLRIGLLKPCLTMGELGVVAHRQAGDRMVFGGLRRIEAS